MHNRSPYLADLTAPVIENFRLHHVTSGTKGSALYGAHSAIAVLGFVDPPLRSNGLPTPEVEGVDMIWKEWVERWAATTR